MQKKAILRENSDFESLDNENTQVEITTIKNKYLIPI